MWKGNISTINAIQWSPRVPLDRIRKVYENDQEGLFDADLLQDVGYRLLARCTDIIQVTHALSGRVHCRQCDWIIPRLQIDTPGEKEEILHCPNCGWQVQWGAFFKSSTGRKLRGGEVLHVYEAFVASWRQAHTVQDKMIAIDTLIHQFHTYKGVPGKSVAVTVISGSAAQVNQLIDNLAYGTVA